MKIYSIKGKRVDEPQYTRSTGGRRRKVKDNSVQKMICVVFAVVAALALVGVAAYLLSLIHWIVAVVFVSIIALLVSGEAYDRFHWGQFE